MAQILMRDANGAWVDISLSFADAAHAHSFASLTSKPTTLAGYGITDAGSDAELAAHESDTTGVHGIADTSALVLNTRAVNTQHSLTGGGNLSADRTLSLVNDAASPGNSKYYGTDSGGTKGYHALPAAGPGGEAFPVGSIYIAAVSTNPATLLGYGTWQAFGAGRVPIGIDSGDTDFDTAEETGGAKTHAHAAGTYAAANGATGVTISDHASHTHGVTSNVAVANHASHTHTYTEVPNHLHTLATGTGATGNFSQVIGTVDTSSGGTGGTPTQTALGTLSGNPVGGVASGTTAGPSATLTHSVTNNAVTSDGPNATLSHTVNDSGHTHTISGSSAAGSSLPPYIVVYMWKRTA
jgi:hypothetical protein